MNREIKFRAWDKKQNKFAEGISIEIDGRIGKPLGRYNLMQFTGLKDKNGKEIYEGDIVKAPAMKKDAICEVFWGMNCWIIKNKESQTGLTNYGGKFAPEVIGNIYENKELLT